MLTTCVKISRCRKPFRNDFFKSICDNFANILQQRMPTIKYADVGCQSPPRFIELKNRLTLSCRSVVISAAASPTSIIVVALHASHLVDLISDLQQ